MDQTVIEDKCQSCLRNQIRILIIFLRWYWMIESVLWIVSRPNFPPLLIIIIIISKSLFQRIFLSCFILSFSAPTECLNYCKLTPEQLMGLQLTAENRDPSDQDSDPAHIWAGILSRCLNRLHFWCLVKVLKE